MTDFPGRHTKAATRCYCAEPLLTARIGHLYYRFLAHTGHHYRYVATIGQPGEKKYVCP